MKNFLSWIILVMLCSLFLAGPVFAASETSVNSTMPWWAWPVILFITTFILGVLAVLGGVGGGVLFVPIVGGFFPFSMDFVRGAGLFVALSGALAAGPGLLKRGFADLRLAIPLALIASASSIVGAMIGLALPSKVVNIALGGTILFIVVIMFLAKKSEYPEVKKADTLSQVLKISGVYNEISTGKEIEWKVCRTPQALCLFIVIGLMAGMFGLGAGWANVPVLNLLMGAPLKVSVATSKFLLSITDTSAAWIYLNNGAVMPMIVVPSIIGIMLGSVVGVRILAVAKPKIVRYVVIIMLLFAGLRALLKGLEIWK
ncbi:sulfite exporter TauE/SafE family protein [Thermodesulfovibrio thiophilus]|uniref:sulfite exporter TauE/SafE family protein n=1 Tax=Thermodesulfovibrio thiophilus TaxID=340095 RepID=UPI000424734B|nr:sulfite exporter TauE/SafE family protein [Thermodesulfovibrio thiophilus]HHW20085.1 sulfite exporter TauE/SafE family protein [Thermodesulfovibrio thiophilus]